MVKPMYQKVLKKKYHLRWCYAKTSIITLYKRHLKMGNLITSEDSDEMRHNIRVCTICKDNIDLQNLKRNTILLFGKSNL